MITVHVVLSFLGPPPPTRTRALAPPSNSHPFVRVLAEPPEACRLSVRAGARRHPVAGLHNPRANRSRLQQRQGHSRSSQPSPLWERAFPLQQSQALSD